MCLRADLIWSHQIYFNYVIKIQGEVGDSMEITANAAANSSSVLNAAISRSKNETVEGLVENII